MVKFIIKRPVMVSMFLVGLFLLGIVSYNKLPVELIPYTELPMLIVQVGTARDADPNYVESQAVVELESAIAGLENIEEIESYIDRRRAVIYVYYRPNTNLKYAYLRLQESVTAAKSKLGNDFFVTVWKIDTEQLANMFMTLQARGEGDLDQIRSVVDEKVIPKFENIDGIANVAVYGGRQHSIEVLLDEDALQAHELTPSQIASRISSGGVQRKYLGQAFDGKKEYFVNLETTYESTSNLEDVVVKDEGPVLLKDIAQIIDGGAEPESISRINGLESISISLVRDQQANLLELSSNTKELIDELNRQLASDGIQLAIQYNSAETIEDNINIIKSLALIGGLLAIIILWIFLRNLFLVLIVATSIPLSIMIAMNFFYAFDISINTLTLVGLAIAIGMLIDNSIVVLENIHRLLARGKSVYEAVVTGTGEVGRAITAATLTTVCVFVPFIFSDNFLIQVLGWQIGVSVISTLLVSLIVAFVLIPVFTYYFLSHNKQAHFNSFETVSQNNRLMQIYTLLLKSCFRFPARTIIIGVTLFFASVVICLALSINVSDEVQTDSFNLYVTMPSGTTLQTADEQVIEMDKRLEDIAEIQDRLATIEEDNVTINFKLKEDFKGIDRRDIPEIKDDILEKLESSFPRVTFSYQQPTSSSRYRSGGGGGGGMGGGRGGQMFERLLGIGTGEEKVVIRGNNIEILKIIADNIQYNLESLETITNTSLNISEQQPAIELLFDKKAMSYFNITVNTLMSELSSFQGETSANATIKRGNDLISVILKSDTEIDKTTDDLRQLRIPSSSGGTVPLMQMADLLYNTGTSNIYRSNQQKQIEVSYRFADEVTGSNDYLKSARQSVDQIVESIQIPSGVAVETVHDETDYSDFYFIILASIILIYMILASVFESLLTPLAMMFTLPIATIGAFWGLILTGNSVLNSNALIGFLILLGVVVNNGIILIDYSRVLRKRNFRLGRALMAAGQARVRPILITAITTILAMFPLAMGKAEYVAQIGAPFAITVIGGLTAGTMFTLILVPTVSFGLQNAIQWWRDLSGKIRFFQLLAFVLGLILIYYNVDSYLWRIANVTAMLIVIPAFTYFTMTSLRRSRKNIIPEDEAIHIKIRNVVKIYDDFSRFIREWRKAERQDERLTR
ncbi:MAG: efflux RND transporter permease subunit, partial [Candidatus Zixiibacteriota bacterium]